MIKEDALIIGGVALAVIGLAWYAKKQIGDAIDGVEEAVSDAAGAVWEGAKNVAPYVNPVDERNVINQGFTKTYQWATGSTGTLGSDVYDITHDGTLNPTSSNNIANRSVNAWVHFLTGDKNQTLGGWIYDKTH